MSLFLVGSLVLIIVLTGVIMAIMPWLQRKNECFAVTVPERAQCDSRLTGMKKRFTTFVLLLTALCSMVFAAVVMFGDMTTTQGAFVTAVFIVVGSLLPIIVGFALMLKYRKRVQAIKKAEGWRADDVQESIAVVDENIPKPLSLVWNVVYIPIVVLTLAIGVAGYAGMPDMVPMHMDFAGNINGWAPKSPKVILFPVAVQLFLIATFIFCHWSIMRSKRPTDPWSPATSALAYGMFARAQSVYLFATGIAMSLAMGVTIQLSNIGKISLMDAMVPIMIVTLFVVVGAIVLSVVYGQAGSRVFKRMQNTEGLRYDDDQYWKLGVFYFNSEDPSLFLPERFGVGWTINLARPAAWMLIIGLILISIVFVVLANALVG